MPLILLVGSRPLSSLTSRERVLNSDELRTLWLALNDLSGLFGPLLKVLLLSGQRRSEVVECVGRR